MSSLNFVPVRLFIITLFLLTISSASILSPTLAEEEINVMMSPNWVIDRNIDPTTYLHGEDPDGGVQILLSDLQIRYDETGPEVFSHLIARLHSISSIENFGTQTIAWFPAYQTYKIHQLTVWRDGKALDMLPSVKATFTSHDVAPGTPAHEGQATIQLYLSDLQRGDVLDISYSVHGQNAAFGGRIFGANVAVTGQLAHNIYRRYLVPNTKKITIINNGGHKKAEVKDAGNYRSYEWYWNTLDKTILENDAPNWYSQIPTMMFNDFSTWRNIISWAEPLFDMQNKRTETILSLATDLIADTEGDLPRLQTIYNFMQSEIRYVGMEIGRNGYKPFDPKTVLERRYGDCKDQAMLMIALLAEAGITAHPALVNSQGGKIMDLIGISPLAFNHVIVRAEIGSDIYWLDPTRHLSKDHQADLTPPRFEKALLLHAGATELTDIPLKETDPESPHILVTDHYNFVDGVFGKLQWTRKTKSTGEYADGFRQVIENIGIRQLGIGLREQYKRNHDGLENSELTTFKDDENHLTLLEEYTIPNAGIYDPQRNITEFEYRPRNIAEVINRPRQIKNRKAPYALSFPLRRRTELNISVNDVPFEEFKSELESPYHRYKNIGRIVGDTFRMTIDYETLKDHVPPEDIEEHALEIGRIWDEIFIRIWAYGESPISHKDTYAYQPAADNHKEVLIGISDEQKTKFQKIMTRILTRVSNSTPLDGEYTMDLLTLFDPTIDIKQSDKNALLIMAASKLIAKGDKKGAMAFLTLFDLMELEDYEDILEFRAQINSELGLFEEEKQDLKYLIASSGYRNPLKNSIWKKQLRNNLWLTGSYEDITTIIKKQLKSKPTEQLYRELVVAYDILGKKSEARRARDKMKKLGFLEAPDVPYEEKRRSQKKEKAYLLLNVQPRYPREATDKNIEGYAVAEFDIQSDGKVSNCKIIDSDPEKIFDDTTCSTVNKFIYYPPRNGQIKKQYRTRLRYEMAQ